MQKPVTFAAARLLASGRPAQAGPIDWSFFIDLIAESVKVLASGCAPSPSQGLRYVSWKPVLDPFGSRLRRHRNAINRRMETHWKGGVDDFEDVKRELWLAVDQGHVTRVVMEQLYAENV